MGSEMCIRDSHYYTRYHVICIISVLPLGQRITNAQHPSRCPEEVGDGRRGELGLLPPARWNLGKNRDGQRRMERRKHTTVCEKRRTVQKKYAARKKRRHRRNRRAARELRVEAKARSRAGELVVGTFNVRTLAFNGKNGIGHSEVILKVCLLYTSPSPRDGLLSRMPSSA